MTDVFGDKWGEGCGVEANWTIKQPQFWARIIIDSENVVMRDVLCQCDVLESRGEWVDSGV